MPLKTRVLCFIYKKSSAAPGTVPGVPVLTTEEKQLLFSDAMGYRGGAAPPQQMMDEIEQRRTAALSKIEANGLLAEFNQYMKSQELLPSLP